MNLGSRHDYSIIRNIPGASVFAGDSAAATFFPLPLALALAGVFAAAFLGDGVLDLVLEAAAARPPALLPGALVSSAGVADPGVFGFTGEAAAFFPPLRVLAGVMALATGGERMRFEHLFRLGIESYENIFERTFGNYRVTQKVSDMGWVVLDFKCSTI